MYGESGCGKTATAYAISRLAEFAFYNVPALLYAMQEEIHLKERINRGVMDRVLTGESELKDSKLPMLILDDLGNEKATEWQQATIYHIINDCYVNKRPVIITSNYSLKELVDRVGEHTVSRIAEMCDIYHDKRTDHRIVYATILKNE